MSNQPNYYAIIPANVRYDKNLNANAKLLYGEITALCNATGECWATNSYFANLYGTSTRTISTWISSLEKAGYIKNILIYKENTKEILKRVLKINSGGMDKNFDTPMDKNFQDNITSNLILQDINNTKEYKNKLDKSNLQKKSQNEQKDDEQKNRSFSFNLEKLTTIDRVSKEYKENLERAIINLNESIKYEDFENALLAKGYKYKNFFLAYKAWIKNNSTNKKAELMDRCTNEKSRTYTAPVDPNRPF